MGSLLGGTMRSLPTTRSCLPPVTISPASRIRGRSELFTRTRRFTSAPSPGNVPLVPANERPHAARLAHHHFAGAHALIKGQEISRVVGAIGDHRKDGQVAAADGRQHLVSGPHLARFTKVAAPSAGPSALPKSIIRPKPECCFPSHHRLLPAGLTEAQVPVCGKNDSGYNSCIQVCAACLGDRQ